MRVLGIETSCDETGLAIYDGKGGLLSHVLHSQIDLHAQYGGVVPELASRDHIRRVIPLLKAVLGEANLSITDIDGIAYTAGPGLLGSLLVGASVACSLGLSLDIPAIGVHHMEAHLLATLLEHTAPQFPFLALLVSGGHTMLVSVNDIGQYEILGESLDDAVGEAFDKVAKLLGLPYPGGPSLEKLAKEGSSSRFHFPRPMTDRPGLDFSFSGLKTFAINTFRANTDDSQTRADIARAFEDAIVDTLIIKCKRALKQTGFMRMIVAGGVGANLHLRSSLKQMVSEYGGTIAYPRHEFCTDNGAMIAFTGYQRLKMGCRDNLGIKTHARWPIDSLDSFS